MTGFSGSGVNANHRWLDFDINLVWVQCGDCLRRWHDTGVGHGRHSEHLFDVA